MVRELVSRLWQRLRFSLRVLRELVNRCWVLASQRRLLLVIITLPTVSWGIWVGLSVFSTKQEQANGYSGEDGYTDAEAEAEAGFRTGGQAGAAGGFGST